MIRYFKTLFGTQTDNYLIIIYNKLLQYLKIFVVI